MYEQIKGKLIDKTTTKVVVETGGVGYRLFIPLSTYAALPEYEQTVLLYLSLIVREDAHTLYAFAEKQERDLFELLITISGIGPKSAIGIIGHIDKESFYRAIQNSDARLLSKLPGIGKKTAERLIIEMRDKLKSAPLTAATSPVTGIVGDATSALINLGYPPLKAEKAVRKIFEQNQEIELGQLITKSLQNL